MTLARQSKIEKNKPLDEDTISSDDDSVHILVESLPKLEVNPTSKITSRVNLNSQLKSQNSNGKSRMDASTLRHSNSLMKSNLRQSKDGNHARKTSEGFQKSKITLRNTTKPILRSQSRGKMSGILGKKTMLETLESNIVASENRQSNKTQTIDAILKKSLFGESAMKGKTPGALRLSSQFYGPTNLLELRDKRTKELLSFNFLTRSHLVDSVDSEVD